MTRKPSKSGIDKLQPIVINNINDIRKAIVPFIKEVPESKINFSADVNWTDDGGKKHTSKVDAYSTEPSMRRGLLEGFELVKESQKMWDNLHDALEDDEYAATLPNVDIDKVKLPVDRLIEMRLGGKREGMTIVWSVNGKKIVFDPYNKTLEEKIHESDSN